MKIGINLALENWGAAIFGIMDLLFPKEQNNFQELEALAQKSLDIAVDTQYIMKTQEFNDAINEIRKLFQ